MWLIDVAIVLVIVVGIYGFVMMVRSRSRYLSSHTDRTAESMYDDYRDPRRERDRRTGT